MSLDALALVVLRGDFPTQAEMKRLAASSQNARTSLRTLETVDMSGMSKEQIVVYVRELAAEGLRDQEVDRG